MAHILAARCTTDHPAIRRLDAALLAMAADSSDPRVRRVSRLDLDQGPRVGRVRAAIGLGWHARDRLRRVEATTGQTVDAVIEACVCGHHHLLGLGRVGVATVRWSPRGPDARTWLDRASAQEGALVILDGEVPADDAAAKKVVARLLAALDAAREPPTTPTPGGTGKA